MGLTGDALGSFFPHPVLMHPLVPGVKIPGTNDFSGLGEMCDSLVMKGRMSKKQRVYCTLQTVHSFLNLFIHTLF